MEGGLRSIGNAVAKRQKRLDISHKEKTAFAVWDQRLS